MAKPHFTLCYILSYDIFVLLCLPEAQKRLYEVKAPAGTVWWFGLIVIRFGGFIGDFSLFTECIHMNSQ